MFGAAPTYDQGMMPVAITQGGGKFKVNISGDQVSPDSSFPFVIPEDGTYAIIARGAGGSGSQGAGSGQTFYGGGGSGGFVKKVAKLKAGEVLQFQIGRGGQNAFFSNAGQFSAGTAGGSTFVTHADFSLTANGGGAGTASGGGAGNGGGAGGGDINLVGSPGGGAGANGGNGNGGGAGAGGASASNGSFQLGGGGGAPGTPDAPGGSGVAARIANIPNSNGALQGVNATDGAGTGAVYNLAGDGAARSGQGGHGYIIVEKIA